MDNQQTKKTKLSGSESIARAIVDAGVKLVAAYPGGPITKVVETLIDQAVAGEPYVEWSNCEKVAFETALGCSLAGRRSVMVGKHVGINHILDPLMTANLTGIGAGMVILAGDDPGSFGSQNEQDSRLLGAFAEIPILEPASPQQGYRLARQAFRLSEAYALPVMLRFVADYAGESAPVNLENPTGELQARFDRERRWKALPARVVEDHAKLHLKLKQITKAFDGQPYKSFNSVNGSGRTGIIATGHMAAKLRRCGSLTDVGVLELQTVFPLPERQTTAFLADLKRVYILEEVEPFIENQIRALAQRHELSLKIFGKTGGHVPWEGDFHEEKLSRFLIEILGQSVSVAPAPARTYASRQPFGDGCPYSPFFKTLQQMVRDEQVPKPIVLGETGCLVRLNNPPFEMLDVKYAMGSSIGIACGLRRSGIGEKILAVTGDSAFFHTGLNALVNAAHHQADIIVAVMDNSTAALTGFQVPIGSGSTAMGQRVEPIFPEKIAKALNIGTVRTLDAFDEPEIGNALRDVFGQKGPSFLVVRGRCPYIEKRQCSVTAVTGH